MNLTRYQPDMQARFRRIVELIQGYGLERVH
jgi:hypothetical protein